MCDSEHCCTVNPHKVSLLLSYNLRLDSTNNKPCYIYLKFDKLLLTLLLLLHSRLWPNFQGDQLWPVSVGVGLFLGQFCSSQSSSHESKVNTNLQITGLRDQRPLSSNYLESKVWTRLGLDWTGQTLDTKYCIIVPDEISFMFCLD